MRLVVAILVGCLCLLNAACRVATLPTVPGVTVVPPAPLATPLPPRTLPEKIVAGARAQIGDRYVADYQVIRYPMGDVTPGQGACTDVVIRALRRAGYDLQQAVHKDMRQHFSLYPKRWGLRRPDPNIDHRRVPNLQVYFRRHHKALSLTSDWQPGDIVTWKLTAGGLDHCGIVSDQRNATGVPLVIHNLGRCGEEDALYSWQVTGHFRLKSGRD